MVCPSGAWLKNRPHSTPSICLAWNPKCVIVHWVSIGTHTYRVHCCGPGGSMHACHAAGPGSIPGRDKLPGWGFFVVFPHLQDKCREALGPQGSRISFGHHYHHHSSFITGANDLRCWCALKPSIYKYTYTLIGTLYQMSILWVYYTLPQRLFP